MGTAIACLHLPYLVNKKPHDQPSLPQIGAKSECQKEHLLTVQGHLLTVQGQLLTVQGHLLTVQGTLLTVQGSCSSFQGSFWPVLLE